MSNSDEYERGLRDGRLASLEETVKTLTHDLDTVKKALWLLYGAIGLVGILPEVIELIGYGR